MGVLTSDEVHVTALQVGVDLGFYLFFGLPWGEEGAGIGHGSITDSAFPFFGLVGIEEADMKQRLARVPAYKPAVLAVRGLLRGQAAYFSLD